jgi:hypothetical protein
LNLVGIRGPAKRDAAICLALFALNALICAPLFGVEYLDAFQSNEGTYITFGEFLRRYWPHVGWFPWFNAGMPFEDTYLPLLGVSTALGSLAAGCSPAHAFHFLLALTYSLGPVFLFLFARRVSGRIAPSLWAALFWSLLSPAALFPRLWSDTGMHWGMRRLTNIVFYGESPHNVVLSLLPLSLLLTARFLDAPTIRRFVAAVAGTGAVMLTNAFGVVVVAICFVILCAARGKDRGKALLSVAGIILLAYLAICRALPPSLIRLMETNSQSSGGDFRFTYWTPLLGVAFLASLIALWSVLRSRCSAIVQFAALFSACFGGITWLGIQGINILPQPLRYHIEMEAGLCLLAAFLLESLARRLPRKTGIAVTLACLLALSWAAVKDYRFARKLIRPTDIAKSPAYREAHWIADNLPGQRVLMATEGQWLFNLFADNPQMSGGHEPSAPNWTQQVAIYTILSGANAGQQDAAISILWLKAFGCGAIVVPGVESKDYFHAVADPKKFEGRLPLLWREAGESIYRVPQHFTSLAHVIPQSAIVEKRPVNGLDVSPLGPYIAALENPVAPEARLSWMNPDHGRIVAKMAPSDVVSVQMTDDPGWRARIGDRLVPLRADQLGFIVIEPRCIGECSIDLEFQGGTERNATLAVSSLAVAGLLAMLLRSALPGRKAEMGV